MKTNIYNSMNNLFQTDEDIDELINKLKNKRTNKSDFKVEGDELIYKPLNFKIIKKKDIPKLLDHLFKTDTNTFSKGIVPLYKYIRTMYGNITRDDIKEFLQNQPTYQLTKQRI